MRITIGVVLVLAIAGCKKTKTKPSRPLNDGGSALAGQVLAEGRDLMKLARTGKRSSIAARVDPELGMRLEAAFLHSRTRPMHRGSLVKRWRQRLGDATLVQARRAGITQRLAEGLTKECRLDGPAEERTPRWPPGGREGWELISETAAMTAEVFDIYARCREGANLEIRFARRRTSPRWRIVGATALPFGAARPATPRIARWPKL